MLTTSSGVGGEPEESQIFVHVLFFRTFFVEENSYTAKINMEPTNDGLEHDLPLLGVYSQVPALNLVG